MRLKKLSAFFALLAIILLIGHVGFSIVAYILFLYNPLMTKLFAIPFLICACLHGILAMFSLFWQGEGTALSTYPGMNRSTLLQRATAALLFPGVILHMYHFGLLQASAESGRMWLFWLLLVFQLLFYAVVITHVTVSFSKALITLGLVSSRKVQKTIDSFLYVLGAVVFVVTTFVITYTQLAMFLGGGQG